MAEEKKTAQEFYAELEEKLKWYMSHKTKVCIASDLLSKYSEEVKNEVQSNQWKDKGVHRAAKKYWDVIYDCDHFWVKEAKS